MPIKHISEVQSMSYLCDAFVLLIFVDAGLSGHNACLLASSSYNSAKANYRKQNSFYKSNCRTTRGRNKTKANAKYAQQPQIRIPTSEIPTTSLN